MNKAELRRIYSEKRQTLSARDALTLSGQIAEKFFTNVDLSKTRSLATFIRILKFNEIDTSTIYYKLWRDFPSVRTFAPRTNLATCEIENISFDAGTELLENEWSIREPANGESVKATNLDLILVPLLCFDRLGYRVGYGKGFYDRFLSTCRADCVKIGLSYFPPDAAIDDIGEHDVKLDYCVTPECVFEFGTKKDAEER